MSKHIGTIIDKSFFDIWRKDDEVWQICYNCLQPKLMRNKNGFRCQRLHLCNPDRDYWMEFMNWEWGQFIFIAKGK